MEVAQGAAHSPLPASVPHPQLEFGMLPRPLSLPGSSCSELPAWHCRELRFPVLPSHPGEAEREWVDGARGAGPQKSPQGVPLGQEVTDAPGPFSPEQVMKAGALPRELVLSKQSSRERRLPQESTAASHRTGRWIPGSGWPWLFPAVPQRSSRQMRVTSCGQMCGVLATAPHSPCLCSSRKPEQLKFPSTSRSRGGPGEGLVVEEVVGWDGIFFPRYLGGNSPV